MGRETRGACILGILAGLSCLALMGIVLLAGWYFSSRPAQPSGPDSSPVAVETSEVARLSPALRLEGTALGEKQASVQRRFPQMLLTEAQTVPLIYKGFAHGVGTKEEPMEVLFRDGKVIEIRFARSLDVKGVTFLAQDKPCREALSQVLGVEGEELRLTQLPPTFWQFAWDDQKLSVVVLDEGHYFSLNSR